LRLRLVMESSLIQVPRGGKASCISPCGARSKRMLFKNGECLCRVLCSVDPLELCQSLWFCRSFLRELPRRSWQSGERGLRYMLCLEFEPRPYPSIPVPVSPY
jgi:hypothetical protein